MSLLANTHVTTMVLVKIRVVLEKILDRASLIFCWIGVALVVVGGISLIGMALTSKGHSDMPTSESQMDQWQPPDDRGWSDGR